MGTPSQTLGRAIDLEKNGIAGLVVDEQWARHPEFTSRYGDIGRRRCIEDVGYNLSYLAQAMIADSPRLFANYVDWVKALFYGLNIPAHELAESLEITRGVLQRRFPDANEVAGRFIDVGIEHVENAPVEVPDCITDDNPLADLAREYLDALLRGERSHGMQLILHAIENGVNIKDVYLNVFQPCQHEVGRLWQMNDISVAQEHYCTAATQLIMSQVYPRIFATEKTGRRLIATGVGGELHEIGLRMVADLFELEGWDTHYLGANVPTSSIVQTLRERDADALAISVTMTFHVDLAAELIDEVRGMDVGARVKIITGGYPFNVEPELWRRVGADGYAPDAGSAITTANQLVSA